MSLFSDISGFNSKALKNFNDNKVTEDNEFSEVDFCQGEYLSEDSLFPSNSYASDANSPFVKEYEYEDSDYSQKFDTEG